MVANLGILYKYMSFPIYLQFLLLFYIFSSLYFNKFLVYLLLDVMRVLSVSLNVCLVVLQLQGST